MEDVADWQRKGFSHDYTSQVPKWYFRYPGKHTRYSASWKPDESARDRYATPKELLRLC